MTRNAEGSGIGITSIILIFMAILIPAFCYADSGFNVQTVICGPAWYCTNYSQSSCGTRNCIDVNTCGVNSGKPTEYIACSPTHTGGGGGGGSSMSIIGYPEGYFTISADLLKIDLLEGQITKSIIAIRSYDNSSIKINIIYPPSMPDFVKAEPSIIETKNEISQVGLYFDSMNISPGTYVILIEFRSQYNSKNMTAVVTINPLVRPNMDFDIRTDSRLKIIGIDAFLNFSISFDKQHYDKYFDIKKFNITCTIIDSYGSIIYDKTESLYDYEENKSIALASDSREGYYVILTTISNGNVSITKNKIITLLSESKYHLSVEQPALADYDLTLTDKIIILMGIMSIIILIVNITISYRRKLIESQGPNIIRVKKAEDFQDKAENKKLSKSEKHDMLLKKSLDEGFITEKEYHSLVSDEKESMDKIKEHGEIIDHADHKEQAEDIKAGKKDNSSQEPENQEQPKPSHQINPMKVSADKAFYVINSRALHSIKELEEALVGMPPETFYHHVTNDKNDFANWVRDVFEEKKLAHEMRKGTTPDEMKEIISNFR